MKITKKGVATAAFVAVAGASIAGTVYEFVPPFNGSQPMSTWQNTAENAMRNDTTKIQWQGHNGQVNVVLPTPVSNASSYQLTSVTPANDPGTYDSKLMNFNVNNSILGVFQVQTHAQVKCDQAKIDGFRGGTITCTVVAPQVG